MIDSLAEEELAQALGGRGTSRQIGRTCCAQYWIGPWSTGGDRWSRAVTAVAWIHLSCFLACQVLYDPSVQARSSFWCSSGLESWPPWGGGAARVGRGPAGSGRRRRSASWTRLWATFLILFVETWSCSMRLTGWESRWYKLAWGTLSTFFFAALAWLLAPSNFSSWPCQMYFTALPDRVHFKDYENLIYGVSLVARPSGHRLDNPVNRCGKEGLTLVAERCFLRACSSKARDGSGEIEGSLTHSPQWCGLEAVESTLCERRSEARMALA